MSSNKIEISVKDIPEIIKTLEEAEKEIEFERKSKNLFIDDLYKVCEISLKQDKEIERLNGALQTHEILLKSNVLEIERLNNIINELEKYVIDREERSWDDNGAYDDVLDKLQELKGSDKE